MNLQLNHICNQGNESEVIAQLKKLPRGLAETDERIWTRINTGDRTQRHWALRTLKWVLYAREPLNPRQMLCATSINPPSMIYNRSLEASDIIYLIRVCANFIVLDEQMNVLRFVHFSAQEFLREKLGSDATCNAYLADVCCGLLGVGPSQFSQWENTIYRYASKHWQEHVRYWDEVDTHRGDLIRKFLLNKSAFESWHMYRSDFVEHSGIPENFNHYQVTAYLNLPVIFKYLLKYGSYTECSRLLLNAVEKNHHQLVRVLVDAGTDVNTFLENCETALILAVNTGSMQMVGFLLNSGANVNARGRGPGPALTAAVTNQSLEIVTLLLDSGADANANAGTALIQAAGGRSVEIVTLLLDRGADVNSDEGKALVAAVNNRSIEMVTLLLAANADVNAGAGNALAMAIKIHSLNMVTLLMAAGADINAFNGRALVAAITERSTEMVTLLLEAGANPNAGGWDGCETVLVTAVELESTEIVTLLLDAGADPNVSNGTALCVAIRNRFGTIVERLLEAGADAETKVSYQTGLMFAVQNGYREIVELLLQAGASVTAKDWSRRSLLQVAIYSGYSGIADLLRARGAI